MAKTQQDEGQNLRCFFITPIGSPASAERRRADWIFKHVLQTVCAQHGLTPERADLMVGSPMITTRIFEALKNAPICVADLTSLNANVFYELGVRHTFQKPVLHIAQLGTELPFDNAQHDTFFYDAADYDSLAALIDWLKAQFDIWLDSTRAVSNPLTAALGAIQLSTSGDSEDAVLATVVDRLASIERRLAPPPAANRSQPPADASVAIDSLSGLSARGESIWLDDGYWEGVVANIRPWDAEEARRLHEILTNSLAIQNKEVILRRLRDKFPQIPF